MSKKYPEPSESKISAFHQNENRKTLIVWPAIAICFLIWGSSIYGFGEYIPDKVVSAAVWTLIPLILIVIISKCPKCDRYNGQRVACSACKFQFPKNNNKTSA